MNPESVEKVLVVKFFGIGSLVLATPLFREARKLFPNADIHLLTLASNRQIVQMIPDLDRVHFIDLGSNVFSAMAAFTAGLFRTFKQRHDVLIDMEFYTRASAIMSLASRARIRIGYHSHGVIEETFKVTEFPLTPIGMSREISSTCWNRSAIGNRSKTRSPGWSSPAATPCKPTQCLQPSAETIPDLSF